MPEDVTPEGHERSASRAREGFRRLARDIFAYGVLGGFSRGVTLLLLPVLTRYFGPRDYGLVDIVATFCSLLTIVASAVLESAVARFWFEAPSTSDRRSLVSTALALITCIGGVLVAASYLVVPLFYARTGGAAESACLTGLAGLIALTTAAFGVPQVVLRMEHRVVAYNGVIFLQGALHCVLAIVALFRYKLGVPGFFGAQLLATFIALLASLVLIRPFLGWTWSHAAARRALAYSLPLVPAGAAVWINAQADRLLLLKFIGLNAVGIFGAAAKLALVVALLASTFQLAWMPIAISLADNASQRVPFYQRVLRYYILCFFSICLLLSAFGPELLHIVAGQQYEAGYVVLPWVMGAQALQGSAAITNLGMLVSKKTAGNSVSAWVGASVNIMAATGLIAWVGLQGAAIGAFVAALVFTLLLARFSSSLGAVTFDAFRSLSPVAVYAGASAAMLAVDKAYAGQTRSLLLRCTFLMVAIGLVTLLSRAPRTPSTTLNRSQGHKQ